MSLPFYSLIEKIVDSFQPLVAYHPGNRPCVKGEWFKQPVPLAGQLAAQQLLTEVKAANDGGYHNLEMLWDVFWNLEQFYCLGADGHGILRCPWQGADPYRLPVLSLIDLLDYLCNEIERIKYPDGR